MNPSIIPEYQIGQPWPCDPCDETVSSDKENFTVICNKVGHTTNFRGLISLIKSQNHSEYTIANIPHNIELQFSFTASYDSKTNVVLLSHLFALGVLEPAVAHPGYVFDLNTSTMYNFINYFNGDDVKEPTKQLPSYFQYLPLGFDNLVKSATKH